MNPKTLRTVAFIDGVLATVFYLLHDILGGLKYPGYSWLSMAVSDLTSAASPSRYLAEPLSRLYGIFAIFCLYAIVQLVINDHNWNKRRGIYVFFAMNIISAIGYTLFPLNENGEGVMHLVVTGLVVLTSVTSLVLIAFGCMKKEKPLGLAAAIALGFMMLGAIGSALVPKAIFGLVERFSTYSAVFFTLYLGCYFRKEPGKKKSQK